MRRDRSWIVAGIAAAAVSFLAGTAVSQDKKDTKQEEEMKAWMAMCAPGPEHKLLERMVGDWDVDSKTTVEPGKPPEICKGHASMHAILGGRYVVEDYSGTMMAQPFEGHGIFGFDSMKKKYTSVWMDTMSTSFMVSEGTGDAKTTTLLGSYPDPQGNTWGWRQVSTFVDADHWKFEAWNIAPDAIAKQHPDMPKEQKAMEVVYTRKK